MLDRMTRTGIKCDVCGYELLALEDKVFCQICQNKGGTYKQVKPNGL